jgi:hypothetical protein
MFCPRLDSIAPFSEPGPYIVLAASCKELLYHNIGIGAESDVNLGVAGKLGHQGGGGVLYTSIWRYVVVNY